MKINRKYYFKLLFLYFLNIINNKWINKQLLLVLIKFLHYYFIPFLFIICYQYGNVIIKKIIIFLIFLIFISQIFFRTCLIYEFEFFLQLNNTNINMIINHFELKIKKNKFHFLPFSITAISFFLFIIYL